MDDEGPAAIILLEKERNSRGIVPTASRVLAIGLRNCQTLNYLKYYNNSHIIVGPDFWCHGDVRQKS